MIRTHHFSHPMGGVSPIKQEEKEEKKKEIDVSNLPVEILAATSDAPEQQIMKTDEEMGERPWYENLIQGDAPKEGDYHLPSIPTWRRFETSKIGKAIDAKRFRKGKDKMFKTLGYEGDDQLEGTVDIANWLPFVGEGIDAVRAVTDLAKKDYTGAAINTAGFSVPFLPGGIVKKGFQKLARKYPIPKKWQLQNIFKKSTTKPKGGVAGAVDDPKIVKMNQNIDKYGQPNPTIYKKPTSAKEYREIVNSATQGTAQTGKSIASNLDEATAVIKKLDPKKSIKKLGVTSGKNPRTIYEVTYPDGQKLRYWESSGSAGKPVVYSKRNSHLNAENSKGHFGVLPGNMDASVVGGSKSWYIKADGWERGYGSEIIEETGVWLKSLADNGLLP